MKTQYKSDIAGTTSGGFREDLEAIAANFERRARDLLEHYNRSHETKSRQERYDKMLVAYTIWRDAARVLRGVAEGNVTVEKLRKVTEDRHEY